MRENAEGQASIVIGKQLAKLLNVELGDVVTAFSIRNTELSSFNPLQSRPDVKQFYVEGIYKTQLAKYDEYYVYAQLESTRDLFSYGSEEVSRLDVFVSDPDESAEIAREIDLTMGVPYQASTVFQIYRQYFAWVKLQQTITPVVISLIILVAAFNIFGTLLMIMFEKTREIGVLGSMGASPTLIFRLFLFLGISIGGAGVLMGQVLALGLALLQKRYGIIPLPAESYYMDVAPISLNGLDFVLVSIGTLLLCAMSSSVPALIASYVKPIKAIRFR